LVGRPPIFILIFSWKKTHRWRVSYRRIFNGGRSLCLSFSARTPADAPLTLLDQQDALSPLFILPRQLFKSERRSSPPISDSSSPPIESRTSSSNCASRVLLVIYAFLSRWFSPHFDCNGQRSPSLRFSTDRSRTLLPSRVSSSRRESTSASSLSLPDGIGDIVVHGSPWQYPLVSQRLAVPITSTPFHAKSATRSGSVPPLFLRRQMMRIGDRCSRLFVSVSATVTPSHYAPKCP